MSGSFGSNALISTTAGGMGAAGTGAHTIAVLYRSNSTGSLDFGLMALRAGATLTRELFVDGAKLFNVNDFTAGFGTIVANTWYVSAVTKPSGSAHYRYHHWAYTNPASGSMSHGETSSPQNHGDGSTITVGQVSGGDHQGNNDNLIAVVGVWTSALSDANLNTLVSNAMTDWAALSPAALFSLENWNGTTGLVDVVGTATQSGVTGTVSVGADPPGFDYSIGSGEVDGSGSVTLASPSGTGAGKVYVTGFGSVTLASPSGTGAGETFQMGSGSLALPALVGTGAGQAIVLGAGSVTLDSPSGTGDGSGTVTVFATGSVALSRLIGSGSARVIVLGAGSVILVSPVGAQAETVYVFTPPFRTMTVMMGSVLRYSYPVSETVWRDENGVWQHMETPSNDFLLAASKLLAVTGRPQIVDEATAAELVTAGIGTIEHVKASEVPELIGPVS
jgi:hypothetical protein